MLENLINRMTALLGMSKTTDNGQVKTTQAELDFVSFSALIVPEMIDSIRGCYTSQRAASMGKHSQEEALTARVESTIEQALSTAVRSASELMRNNPVNESSEFSDWLRTSAHELSGQVVRIWMRSNSIQNEHLARNPILRIKELIETKPQLNTAFDKFKEHFTYEGTRDGGDPFASTPLLEEALYKIFSEIICQRPIAENHAISLAEFKQALKTNDTITPPRFFLSPPGGL